MRNELANQNGGAVPFLSCAATKLYWYYCTYGSVTPLLYVLLLTIYLL